MSECDSCGAPVAETARFCPECGSPLTTADAPTVARPAPAGDDLDADSPTVHRPSPSPRPSSSAPSTPSFSGSGSLSHGRFLPGQVLGGRFRIIAILGKGGMGEVYRADDLALGQPVALKFLPEALAGNAERLERFRAEVRMARQVAHPNVCRVYDIGALDGEHFLSMEYVEGEDLAHLLKRIGQLPQAKAIQIARQIAAGLAAAHAKGLIHRDLKPANVMLDERGTVRVTDFGLAGTADDFARGNVSEGTPQYMAPEQLRGESVSVRSDIYSLGLVMFELFTGRKAFEAAKLSELLAMRSSSTVSEFSGALEDVDPAVARVILRCLEDDPAQRPSSALVVAAALPGGDPLAAALEAGETPSPEMVAAAGDEGLIRPAWAVAAFAIATILVLVNPLVGRWITSVPGGEVLEHPPAVMNVKGRELLARLGYEARPSGSAGRHYGDTAVVRHVAQNDKDPGRWARLLESGYPLVRYWLRESPRPLVTFGYFGPGAAGGTVMYDDPPLNSPGMLRLTMTGEGRLWSLEAVPHPAEIPAGEPFDFDVAIREAGFDPASLETVEPSRLPPVFADARAAWMGKIAGDLAFPVRIEAAALGASLVYFEIFPPWKLEASEAGPRARSRAEVANNALQITVFLVVIGGSLLLARRNLRSGRGDRRGASRIAAAVAVATLFAWLLQADHVAGFAEFGLFVIGVSWALFLGATVWVLYVALEPVVRRRWPTMLISWSRLLAGRLKDPLVARDILTGTAVGAAVAVALNHGIDLGMILGGGEAERLKLFRAGEWPDVAAAFGMLFERVRVDIAVGFLTIFLLLAFRMLLRRDGLAAGAFVVLLASVIGLSDGAQLGAFVIGAVVATVVALMLVRQGLLAAVVLLIVFDVTLTAGHVPGALDSWAGTPIWAMSLALIALAAFALAHALAGRPIVSGDRFET